MYFWLQDVAVCRYGGLLNNHQLFGIIFLCYWLAKDFLYIMIIKNYTSEIKEKNIAWNISQPILFQEFEASFLFENIRGGLEPKKNFGACGMTRDIYFFDISHLLVLKNSEV